MKFKLMQAKDLRDGKLQIWITRGGTETACLALSALHAFGLGGLKRQTLIAPDSFNWRPTANIASSIDASTVVHIDEWEWPE